MLNVEQGGYLTQLSWETMADIVLFVLPPWQFCDHNFVSSPMMHFPVLHSLLLAFRIIDSFQTLIQKSSHWSHIVYVKILRRLKRCSRWWCERKNLVLRGDYGAVQDELITQVSFLFFFFPPKVKLDVNSDINKAVLDLKTISLATFSNFSYFGLLCRGSLFRNIN